MMPRLNCSAANCSYNNSNYCCKNQIQVSGSMAQQAQSTCCESFIESNGAFTNSVQVPNPHLYVSCEAKNCIHNCNNNCEAESISVGGGIAASTSRETECDSFICK